VIHRTAPSLASRLVESYLIRVHITSAGAGQVCG
jgi:hypothetical protein